MCNLIKQCNSGWKMTPFAAELLSNKSCFYQDICFATETKVWRRNEKSVTLSVLSVLIGRSMLHFLATGDVGTSWLAYCALTRLCQQQSVCSHTVSRLELELRRTSLLCCNFPCNRLVSVQTGLKEREITITDKHRKLISVPLWLRSILLASYHLEQIFSPALKPKV